MLLLFAACAPDYDLKGRVPDVDPADVTECGFTRVEDAGSPTDFYAYDCNPVFTTTGEAWAPTIDNAAFLVTEVFGHPFYQLWYTGVSDEPTEDGWDLGYAVSAEGTDWIPSDANPLIGSESDDWDGSSMDAMQVVWDPDTAQYVMIYQGLNYDQGNLDLGVLTSTDGLAWSRLPQNPVYDLTAPTAGMDGWCWPLGLDLGPVAGFRGYLAGVKAGTNTCSAFELNASDLTSWTPSTESVFPAGSPGTWDQQGQVSLATAALGDQNYLFYVGFGGWQQQGQYQVSQNHFFGMATMKGNGEWDRRDDPIPIHNTDQGEVSTVAARTVGKRIHLWVGDVWGESAGVGYYLFDPDGTLEQE